MPKNISAATLPPGTSTARWGSWVVGVRMIDHSWHVRIWSWSHGARVQIARRAILPSAAEAVAWACEILRQHGAIAFVDGCEQPLEQFLAFSPAPDAFVS